MKYTKQTIKENRSEYFKQANKSFVGVRFTPEEKAVIQKQMTEDGWTNMSGFIRFKLFGWEPENMVEKIIKSKHQEGIGILLANKIEDLTNTYTYLMYRYEKDMNQLWKEEGVNLKDWINVTNRWHAAFMLKLRDAFKLFNMIAKALGIKEASDMNLEELNIDIDNATKEEMDAIAKQIRKRQIALGLPNTFE